MDWWNFDTEQYDERKGPPSTDEAAIQYLLRGTARNLYLCHRELGLSILEAMKEALVGGRSDESG